MNRHLTGRRITRTSRIAQTAAVAVSLLVIFFGAEIAEGADRGLGSVIQLAAENNPELAEMLKDYASPLFVPAADFRTDGLYPEAQSYSLSGYWKGDGLGMVYMMAPVWLPDGAVIDSVWLFAVDDDDACPSPDISAWLLRVDNYTGDADSMVTMSTTGSSTTMQTPYETDPLYPTIEYPSYSYWLTTKICSLDHEMYGVMIFYH